MVWVATLIVATLLCGTTAVLLLAPEDLNANLIFAPLSVEAGGDLFASFSPDGKSIAYSGEVNGTLQVFIRELATGASSQLTNSTSNARVQFWSPDGNRVYYSNRRGLSAVSAAGGRPEFILENVVVASLSPDGRSLVFGGFQSPTTLLLSSPPGQPPRPFVVLPATSDKQIGEAIFSPDGSKVFVTMLSGPAYLVDFPAGTLRKLPHIRSSRDVAWMPDSRHVVYSTRIAANASLMMADTNTSFSHSLLSSWQQLTSLSVAPDGNSVAFSTGDRDVDIVELSTNGEALRPLVETPLIERSGSYSSDAQSMIYEDRSRGIWIRRADGSGPRLLVADPRASRPAYEPNGSRVAYRIEDEVWIVRSSGGAPVQLKPRSGTGAGALCWSPDGEWLAYADGPTTRGRLWKLATTGSGAPIALRQGVVNDAASNCSWSPDGRSIAYRAQMEFASATWRAATTAFWSL
jgi:tricorn protease